MTELPDLTPLRVTLKRWALSDAVIFMLTAVLVGALTGVASLGFIGLIDVIERGVASVRAQFGGPLLVGPALLLVPLIPAAGGLAVGLLITYVAPEMIYGGIPSVLTAIARHGSRLRARLVWAKPLATAICIGTGGSAGRVGPIVQIGAALGSQVGQRFRLTDERIRNLVACGAAAGIASTFNAPIAGVIFALEVILGEFTETYFATIVISAVTSSIISRSVLGTDVAFRVPAYTLAQPLEILFYVVLGGMAALVAWLFILSYYATKDLAGRMRRVPQPLRPALGGLLLGLLALAVPQVLGGGFEEIERALGGELALPLMALLVVAKLVATDLTLGFGSSGGIFAPNLFLGAMLGGAFGEALHWLLPGVALAPSGAYALVGMAAVFAAAAHAPMTALLIVAEMSGSYSLILPLMLATGLSTVMSRALLRESVYTLELARKGIPTERGQEMDVLRGTRVDEVMVADPEPVHLEARMGEVAALIDRTEGRSFPVVNETGALVGIVTSWDLRRAQSRWEDWAARTVAEICTRTMVTAYSDESIAIVLKRMGVHDLRRLPVVDREEPGRLMGMIHQRDISAAYRAAQLHRRQRTRLDARLGVEVPDDVLDLTVTAGAPVVGQAIRDIAWPEGCLVVAVHRGDEVLLGKGDLALRSGDRLTVYVQNGSESALRALVTGEEH